MLQVQAVQNIVLVHIRRLICDIFIVHELCIREKLFRLSLLELILLNPSLLLHQLLLPLFLEQLLLLPLKFLLPHLPHLFLGLFLLESA